MTATADPSSYDLDALRSRVLPHDDGTVDDSIPRLADADPGLCAVALALTASGCRTTARVVR